jgi:hypothetical protein
MSSSSAREPQSPRAPEHQSKHEVVRTVAAPVPYKKGDGYGMTDCKKNGKANAA